jgi:hypothetical protein
MNYDHDPQPEKDRLHHDLFGFPKQLLSRWVHQALAV